MKAPTLPLLCLGVLLNHACGLDFFVSQSGSDSNDGSSDRPFLTLTRAQEAVRKQVATSMTADINVRVAAGIYALKAPLLFNAGDSGKNGFKVNWIGTDATISGGLKLTNWTSGSNGIYSASVPTGIKSRNLYVGGKAANYARRKINRKDFRFDSNGMSWTNTANDWLQTTSGVADGEVRFISSFTDRIAPIQTVANRRISMKRPSWDNQLIGYDTISSPNADFGVWVQNVLSLLSNAGEFYLDSPAGKVYYKPFSGENMDTIDTYLGVQETLLVISGTYDSPVHDISFQNLNFAHTTWLQPGTPTGYVDQQTGGIISDNTSYSADFESARPKWSQMPSAIQISAARQISFSGGTYTQIGSGGIGVGNDANAHLTKVGLGTSEITIQDGYFTQVMGNSITVGGIQANAHHPSEKGMVISNITITGNIFFNTSSLFSSTVPILATYLQYSTISHNDLSTTPYSGLCYGYGWGSNDAGGSPEYVNRGLYKYQPKYTTPTTLKNNLIEGNLIHNFGFSHTDLGGLYTLSKSPDTKIIDNYVYDSSYFGIYNDEGSNSLIQTGNLLFTRGSWYVANNQAGNKNTGNNTLSGNWAASASSPNIKAADVGQTGTDGLKRAYRAGILPGKRTGRPVSNSAALKDAAVDITSSNGQIIVKVTNFDDVAFTDVTFSMPASGLTASNVPTSIPANSAASATYTYSGSKPAVSGTVQYTNPRTGKTSTLNAKG